MSSVTTSESLGVGLVGIGWCAAQHIQAFQKNPHTRVAALCGTDAKRVEANLAKYNVAAPDARITTRYEGLLSNDEIQIVSIATPNNLHAAQAIAAVKAGKHILLEKPTALAGRDPALNVFDAEKTMQICLAADRSAELRGAVVTLPLAA